MILNFHYTNNILERDTKSYYMKYGSTPNDFKRLIAPNGFIIPTICVIVKKGTDIPIYLGNNVKDEKKNCFFSEWDNIVKEDEDCYLISFHCGEAAIVPIVISLIISAATIAATYLLMPKPNIPFSQNEQSGSPTYDLTQQGNKIRRNQPIPVHYGTIRAYPDVAASPITTSVYPNQRFYTVALCVGQGYIEISDIKIDDTPVSDFPWVETTVTIAEATPLPIAGFEKPFITSKEIKNYLVDAIDTAYSPIQTKSAVLRATDININISSPGSSIDFATPIANDEFLLFGQSEQSENGTWKFNSSTTPMTRLTSMDDPSEFLNALVPVTGGTWAGDDFLQVNQISAVGVDPVSFELNTTGTTGDWFILNDATDVTNVKKIYFEFLCQQGLYTLGITITNKPNALVSSPININIASAPVLIDGNTHSNPDIILLINQTASEENGLYVSNGSGNPLTRHTTMDNPSEFSGAVVKVNGGTYAGIRFIQTLTVTVVDVDPVEFATFDPSKTFYNRTVDLSIDIQQIDNLGADIGGVISLPDIKISGSTNQPVFSTVEYTLTTVGRYKAKVRRKYVAGYLTDTNIMDKVEWISFRGQFDYTPEYTHKTFLAIKARASGKLNDSNIGIFNCLGKRRLQVYDFGAMTWSQAQTNSPIWAWYDMATNAIYGCGLDPTAISLDNLEDIYNSINALGLECNTRFDSSVSGEDALEQISVSMRCKTYRSGGMFLLARDEEKLVIAGFFNRDNITEGSVNLEFKNKNSQNPIWTRVTYFDEITAKKETVDCVLAGDTPNDNIPPEEIEVRTITNRTKAWQLGMYYTAQNAYRRESISFSTTMEGFIPTIFDKISITHPTINPTYQSGKVQKVIGSTIYLSEPIAFNGYETGFITFRKKDGTALGPYICSHGVGQYSVELIKFTTNAPDYTLFPFVSEADQPFHDVTFFTFGVDSSSTQAIVKQIDAGADNQATITAVNHDPRVHTADKPIFLCPLQGSDYIPHDAFICDIEEYQLPTPASGLGCLVNIATRLVTVKFNYSGYAGYVVRYLYNDNGVENLVTHTISTGTAGIKTDTHTYTINPPSRVTVTPIITITTSPAVEEELTSLAVIIPITLI